MPANPMNDDKGKLISCEKCGGVEPWARPNWIENDRGQKFCSPYCLETFEAYLAALASKRYGKKRV